MRCWEAACGALINGTSFRIFCMRLNKYYVLTKHPDVWSEGIPEEQYTE